MDLKLLNAQEKINRSVTFSVTRGNGLRPGAHLHRSRFDPHNRYHRIRSSNVVLKKTVAAHYRNINLSVLWRDFASLT